MSKGEFSTGETVVFGFSWWHRRLACAGVGLTFMNHTCFTPEKGNPPYPPFSKGGLKSPFSKGGFRGIWVFTVKPEDSEFSPLIFPSVQYSMFDVQLS
jgi:hypothetical protein